LSATCRRCGYGYNEIAAPYRIVLQVDHLRYSKGELWDVPDSWLITLCQHCHELKHGISFSEEQRQTKRNAWSQRRQAELRAELVAHERRMRAD
jgi:hypothetical protein